MSEVKNTLGVFSQLWPLAFNLKDRKPLKSGIHEDIEKELPELPKKDLQNALRHYIVNPAYQKKVATMSHRIDLLGNEVEEITEEHKQYADQCAKHMKEKMKARAKAKKAEAKKAKAEAKKAKEAQANKE